MPGPVPIVSPVVPLFIAPLLIPVPGLRRLAPFAELLFWLGVAGEIAESPVVVVEPVLAFCARTQKSQRKLALWQRSRSISFGSPIWMEWVNLRDAMPRRAQDPMFAHAPHRLPSRAR